MIYLVTKLGEVTRAWGGSWADCVREGVNVGKALYPWEPFGRILVEVLSDGSIRELDNIFSCRHPVAITTEEIEGAVVAALESIDNYGYFVAYQPGE